MYSIQMYLIGGLMQMNIDIDVNKVSKKITLIIENLDKLRILKQIPEHEFYSDFRNIEAAKHLLQIAIEAMHDVANHIVSRGRLGRPESYGETFRILEQKGFISTENADIYSTMVKFRNRVVHLYHDVDDHEIYKILQNNLKDIAGFLEEIRLIVNNQNK